MQRITWLLKLLLQAACFFALFAFALNNQHDVTVNFFFGTCWRGPLVLLVLAVFAVGVLLGVLGLVSRWWREQRASAASGAALNEETSRLVTTPSTDPTSRIGAGPTPSRPGEPHGS